MATVQGLTVSLEKIELEKVITQGVIHTKWYTLEYDNCCTVCPPSPLTLTLSPGVLYNAIYPRVWQLQLRHFPLSPLARPSCFRGSSPPRTWAPPATVHPCRRRVNRVGGALAPAFVGTAVTARRCYLNTTNRGNQQQALLLNNYKMNTIHKERSESR